MKFYKDKEPKTTMSTNIMKQVCDIAETELKKKGIFYTRTNTKFKVKQENIKDLWDAQMKANSILIKEGVITLDMIENEIATKFS